MKNRLLRISRKFWVEPVLVRILQKELDDKIGEVYSLTKKERMEIFREEHYLYKVTEYY